ncbi:MAG: hypothetical protein AAB948_02390, partial [Patescibacteria group bacterium]
MNWGKKFSTNQGFCFPGFCFFSLSTKAFIAGAYFLNNSSNPESSGATPLLTLPAICSASLVSSIGK